VSRSLLHAVSDKTGFFHLIYLQYVDELIEQPRQSEHGLHIGQLFVACAVYADDIVLMSASYHKLQKLVNICTQYGAL